MLICTILVVFSPSLATDLKGPFYSINSLYIYILEFSGKSTKSKVFKLLQVLRSSQTILLALSSQISFIAFLIA